jgi:hypothetical protein
MMASAGASADGRAKDRELSVAVRTGIFVLLALAVTSGLRAQEQDHRSIDVLAFCRQTYGDAAGYSQQRTDAYSWRCTSGGRQYPVDMDTACQLQHGAQFAAVLADTHDSFSWSCVQQQK